MKKKLNLNQSKKELEKLLVEKQVAWRTFRFGIAGSKITNVKEARNLRRDIARTMTAWQAKTE